MEMLTLVIQPVNRCSEVFSPPLLRHLRVHFQQLGNLREHTFGFDLSVLNYRPQSSTAATVYARIKPTSIAPLELMSRIDRVAIYAAEETHSNEQLYHGAIQGGTGFPSLVIDKLSLSLTTDSLSAHESNLVSARVENTQRSYPRATRSAPYASICLSFRWLSPPRRLCLICDSISHTLLI